MLSWMFVNAVHYLTEDFSEWGKCHESNGLSKSCWWHLNAAPQTLNGTWLALSCDLSNSLKLKRRPVWASADRLLFILCQKQCTRPTHRKVEGGGNQIILALKLAVIGFKAYLLQLMALYITINPYLAMPLYTILTSYWPWSPIMPRLLGIASQLNYGWKSPT